MKVPQSHPTLCDPRDYAAHGISQVRNIGEGGLSLLQGIKCLIKSIVAESSNPQYRGSVRRVE